MEDNVDRTKDVQIIVDAQHHDIVIDCKDEETTLSITKRFVMQYFMIILNMHIGRKYL